MGLLERLRAAQESLAYWQGSRKNWLAFHWRMPTKLTERGLIRTQAQIQKWEAEIVLLNLRLDERGEVSNMQAMHEAGLRVW